LFLLTSLLTVLSALGVGACALSIIPKEQRPPLVSLGSQFTISSPPSPSTPDVESQHTGQSGTVLEQTTSPDGLVQLVPRKRKAVDATEHNVSCKGPGLFVHNVTVPPVIGENDEDVLPQPGTPSESPLDPAPEPTPPVHALETPSHPPQQQELQLDRPGQMREIKSPRLATRPTHVDLPPPQDLKTLQSPQRTPSPSANRLPQPDITPGLQVLVVDDDKMTRMLFQRMLGRLKCSVTTAVNGYEALQLITGDQNVSQSPAEEEHEHMFSYGEDHTSIMENENEKDEKESKFAIVFLDNQMPVMSGVEMMRKLRKLGKTDLVVGVTGENSRFSSPSRFPMVVDFSRDLIVHGVL